MAISCVVCGEWYPTGDRDTIDICPDCWRANFAGAQDVREPPPADSLSAREALRAYIDSPVMLTPRQVESMRRIHRSWEEEARRRAGGEGT